MAQQQKFKVTPHDLQVLEGSEAVLRCEVSNLAGQVQWTKDGFALGKCSFISFEKMSHYIISMVILSFALVSRTVASLLDCLHILCSVYNLSKSLLKRAFIVPNA